MATNPKINRTNRITSDVRLLQGLTKHAQAFPLLVQGGRSYDIKQMIDVLQQRIDAANEAQSKRAVWLEAVQADRQSYASTKAFLSALAQVLRIAFSDSIENLADFGLDPYKKHVRTPDEKIAVAAKSKATRAARHTMGKKQRAAIKGVV
jgi:hypothetical protein